MQSNPNKLTYLKHSAINLKKWDECILKSQISIPYLYSWYLNATAGDNWDAIIILDNRETYQFVLPLPYKKRLGLKFLVQPYLTQQLGFVGPNALFDEEAFTSILFKHGFVKGSCNFNHSNQIGFGEQRVTFILNLKQPYEQLKSNFSSQRKRDLKKVAKVNLLVEPTQNFQPFIQFFDGQMRDKLSLDDPFFEVLQSLCNALQKNNALQIINVYQNQSLVTSMLLIVQPDYLIYLAGTSNEEGYKYGGMTAAFDYVIRENCEKKVHLDFEGGNISSIGKFFKSFGAHSQYFNSVSLQPSLKGLKIEK